MGNIRYTILVENNIQNLIKSVNEFIDIHPDAKILGGPFLMEGSVCQSLSYNSLQII